jgi:phytanoyl-CoA hydroxylase
MTSAIRTRGAIDERPACASIRDMNTATSSGEPSVRGRYQQDGYVIFREVLDSDLVAEASDHVEWLQKRHPDLRPEQLDTQLVADDPFWVRLVGDDRLLDIAQEFIGSNIALFASHYICKPPFSGQPVLWHQDGAFWPLEPMEVITLWLAVDRSMPENGCLRVIPGSHRMSLQPLRPRDDVENVLESEIAVEHVEEEHALDLVLEPGDVSVHHPNIVHASQANTSSLRRCGLTIRYIPTTTRIVSGQPWPSAFLLRGEASPGINSYRPRPRYVQDRHMPFRGCESWS